MYKISQTNATYHKDPWLKWTHPLSGYIVEKKPKGRGEWQKANAFPCPDLTYTVINLAEGSEMEFRVMAVNDGGPGKPSKPTPPHVVRDPICKFGSFIKQLS